MPTELLITVISSSVALAGYVLGYYSTKRKNDVNFLVWKTEINDKLSSIEEKLDQHNKYAEKFGSIQKSINKIEKENISIRKDIEYLKSK